MLMDNYISFYNAPCIFIQRGVLLEYWSIVNFFHRHNLDYLNQEYIHFCVLNSGTWSENMSVCYILILKFAFAYIIIPTYSYLLTNYEMHARLYIAIQFCRKAMYFTELGTNAHT